MFKSRKQPWLPWPHHHHHFFLGASLFS
jgi:hypothetical protein